MNDKPKTVEQMRTQQMVVPDAQTANALSPFSSIQAFESAQRMARILCGSLLVPKIYQGEDALGDCVIALGMANRLGADPIMVMQNLYVVHGRPAWSGQFVIAAINQSGRFAEPLHFIEVGERGKDSWGFYAETTAKGTGNKIKGPTITIELAKAEGWYGRKDSKWKTMPEMMLRYRAGSWFGRSECPELLMGFQTQEEVNDIIDVDPTTGEVIDQQPERPQAKKFVDMKADFKTPKVTVKVGEQPKSETAPPPKEEVKKEVAKPKPKPKPEVKPEPKQEEAKQEEAKPEMTNQEADRMTQIQDQGYYEDSGRFFNAKGDMWDPAKHATAKATQGPIVNTDGTFRNRRGGPLEEPQDPPAQTEPADPIPDNQDHPGQQAQEPDPDMGDWE